MGEELKLVIFDLDGTILDTLEDLADSVNYALSVHGYPTRTLEEIRRFVGNGLFNLVCLALEPETDEAVAKKVLATQKAYYKEHCADKTKPYDGVLELLAELKEAGYKMAVVSNKADYAVQILCEQYFKGLFDLTIGEREHVRKKPAPDSVNMVLETLQTDRKNAVYIGDSEVDIKTAKNADMKAIFVNWGFRDEEVLREQGAEVIVGTMKELKNLLIN